MTISSINYTEDGEIEVGTDEGGITFYRFGQDWVSLSNTPDNFFKSNPLYLQLKKDLNRVLPNDLREKYVGLEF